MKNALVIAAREFEEKRFVAYAAVAFAVLPFLLAVIPGISGKSPSDVIAASSLIFATGFSVALAVMSGASFIGRDLSDGRMSFYFSRPAGSLSIWFGKLTAAILMIVGTFAFIIVPARLATGTAWKRIFNTTTWDAAFFLAIALSLFLIAHVIGTFARSRSPLIVFDFAAAVICGVSIRFLLLPLFAGGGAVLVKWLSIALAIAAVVGIVGGGAWQLERGRTDRRRNHLALSQFLWGTMAIALLIAAGYVAWVVSVKVGDLNGDVRSSRASSGPFAIVTGEARNRAGYRAGFLLNTADGSATRVDAMSDWFARFTRDGRVAIVPRREGNLADLMIYRQGAAKPIETGLLIAGGDYFVSEGGERIATLGYPSILSIYDVAQKRSLVSVRLPESTFVRAFFVTPDVFRLYLQTGEGMKIAEVDASARALRETGMVPAKAFVHVYPDASATHMLVRTSRVDALTLNDARTGAVIKPLVSGTSLKTARYLRDGRIAIVDGPESASVLHILSSDGVLQRDIAIGPMGWPAILGDDGVRVILSDSDRDGQPALIAANIDRGVIERRQTVKGSVPVPNVIDYRPALEPLREVLYGDADGHIAAWNPATGETRRITGG